MVTNQALKEETQTEWVAWVMKTLALRMPRISQRELAREIGMSQSRMSQVLSDRHVTTVHTRRSVETALRKLLSAQPSIEEMNVDQLREAMRNLIERADRPETAAPENDHTSLEAVW